ncbi:hypothetical protein APR08_004542 [Nocardia amikacinitolerans]|nr:hypothetical protein [Nocardia amikacinitolerans]
MDLKGENWRLQPHREPPFLSRRFEAPRVAEQAAVGSAALGPTADSRTTCRGAASASKRMWRSRWIDAARPPPYTPSAAAVLTAGLAVARSAAIAAAPQHNAARKTPADNSSRINAPSSIGQAASTPPRCNAASLNRRLPSRPKHEWWRSRLADRRSPATALAMDALGGRRDHRRTCRRRTISPPSPLRPDSASATPRKPSGRRLPPHQRPQRLAVGDVHLDAGAVEVALDGADRHGEAVGDLAVGQASGDEVRDFAFAGGEG